MMEERRRCLTCKRYLIASNGLYMHPDKPCSGLKDYLYVSGEVEDDFMHKKFNELYGKPDIDDYDRLELYEQKLEGYRRLMDKYEDQLSNPVVKLINRIKTFINFKNNKGIKI